jgi:hypothetical protein
MATRCRPHPRPKREQAVPTHEPFTVSATRKGAGIRFREVDFGPWLTEFGAEPSKPGEVESPVHGFIGRPAYGLVRSLSDIQTDPLPAATSPQPHLPHPSTSWNFNNLPALPITTSVLTLCSTAAISGPPAPSPPSAATAMMATVQPRPTPTLM